MIDYPGGYLVGACELILWNQKGRNKKIKDVRVNTQSSSKNIMFELQNGH